MHPPIINLARSQYNFSKLLNLVNLKSEYTNFHRARASPHYQPSTWRQERRLFYSPDVKVEVFTE